MIVEEEEQQQKQYEFNLNFPAAELPTKNYSLEADMATGWRPKIKMVGPIPFNFDSNILDEIVDELTSFGSKHKERVLYLGNRYTSSFKMHQEMTHKYKFKHDAAMAASFSHMNAYFKKFHSNFKSKGSVRLFKGMNPTIKTGEQVVFDSAFESGNLDAAIKVGENQYDLFMRIDTNTKGHVQWFNFTIRNFGKKTIRLNIVNFKKYKTLYSREMKPYIYSQHLKQTKNLQWHQGGSNVKYQREKLRYEFLDEIYMEETITYNRLEFDFTFGTDWETVQFAYCPPFTYSETLEMITSLKKDMTENVDKMEQYYIKEETMCESLGGLDIPLLTITDPEVDDKEKRCVMASARIHPGETCGSHMINGFLKFICSSDEMAKSLRKQVVFKIVPMLNPDGVVVGNFRTSLCGRDLNRQFRTSADFLIPEVKAIKQQVIKLKSEFKSKFIFFLDFHGHSVKKNVFFYGPEYEIWETNYYKTRIFPKIIAAKTEIFRYYSCIFRIADFKRTTARAVILNNVPHCFTIEASTGFYYSSQEKKDIPFSIESWGYIGRVIAESIKDYIDLMYDNEMSRQQKKQKLNELKANKFKKKEKERIPSRNGTFQTRLISMGSSQKQKEDSNKREENYFMGLSDRAKQFIEQIKGEDKSKRENGGETNPADQHHDSDQFSEGGSDSEGSEDDIPEEQLRALHQQILNSLKEFRKDFYNKNDRQYSFKEYKKVPVEKHNKRDSVKLKPPKIEMVPSLRNRAESMEKTQSIFRWPKLREESKSFTKDLNEDLSKNKVKIQYKSYIQQIEKGKKFPKKRSEIQLEVLGGNRFEKREFQSQIH